MVLNVSLVLSFLSVACCVVSSQICPVAQDIAPCTCKETPAPATTRCANITNTEMLVNIFSRSVDYPIPNFILRDSNLMYLPARALTTKKVEYVKIENTNMITLFDAVPEKTNLLKELYLINETKVQKGIEWHFFSGLTKLKKLAVRKIRVKDMRDDFKNNINAGLKSLLIRGGQITSIGDTAFADLKELSQLEISSGKIQSLKRSMFPNPSKLKFFDFSANRLATLPDDLFSNMPDLLIINLEGNRLTTFSKDVFLEVYKRLFSNIFLASNPIVCDCNIRWYLPVNKLSRFVTGQCAQPPSKQGRHLIDLTEADFNYC